MGAMFLLLLSFLFGGLSVTMASDYRVAWSPQEGPQWEFCSRGEFEVLYGGAAGGGKSDALLGEALRFIQYPDYRAILFRRTYPMLSMGGGLIDRSLQIYPALGGKWLDSKSQWVFPSGAVIQLRHMQHEHSKYNYQGGQFHYIGFDELTHFTESQYIYLLSRARSANPNIKPVIRAATNPGGVGHLWVKTRFVDEGAFKTHIDPDSGRTRTFIPARVFDNKYFNPDSPECVDPNYVKNMMLLPEQDRLMLLEGNWDVFQGQFFHKFRRDLHVVKPFKLKSNFIYGYGIDFGLNDPFVWIEGCVGMDNEIYGESPIIYITREYTGIETSPQANARACLERMGNRRYTTQVIGKDARKRLPQRDESDSEVRILDLLEDVGLDDLELANNDRKQGWAAISQLLDWEGDTIAGAKTLPRLRIFDTCTQLINTLPALPRDDNDPDDVDKNSTDDHWAEALRYLIMGHYPLHRLSEKKKDVPEDRWRRKFAKNKQQERSNLDRGYLL